MPDGAADGVTAFNELAHDEASEHLMNCLHSGRWAASVLAGRPYADRERLLSAARARAAVLDEADLVSALSAHPRIGEQPAGGGRDAAHSRSEQGGVDAQDAELAALLRAGNVAYEDRFDRVFLIRAAGRTGPQILTALSERLANDPLTEGRVVRDELGQIAALRLGSLLDGLAVTS